VTLILKRATASRLSGEWSDDDYDVLADGVVVGRIMKAAAAPEGTPSGFFNFNGNIRITFESLRVDHSTSPGPLARVVIGRLVMPLATAKALARGLLDFIVQQRTQQNPPAQTIDNKALIGGAAHATPSFG
jgi:hypothetical protein